MMAKTISSIFSGPPKPAGPDPALLKAQQDQQARLDAQDADQTKRNNADRALIAARAGRGAGITLNASTGERGVATLGGQS